MVAAIAFSPICVKIKEEKNLLKVFAISDLHLSTTVNKPMDIFGPNWSNHFLAIKEDWEKRYPTKT